MKKDRKETENRILRAVGSLVAESGFSSLGINAVALRAGVDKVLIYRYFGSFDALLGRYALGIDYLSNLFPGVGDTAEPAEISRKLLHGQLDSVLKNPELQAMLLWELNEKNEITDAVARMREDQGNQVLKAIAESSGRTDLDLSAIASLLVGGIYYLILRSKTYPLFAGIDLTSEKGQSRIRGAIDFVIERLLQQESK